MRRDPLFEECLANVPAEVFAEVNLNIDIANRIADILHEKKMTQREFASLMGKRESEVSRWLTGSHGFTTKTLAKMASVLGEDIIEVKKHKAPQIIVMPVNCFYAFNDAQSKSFTNTEPAFCQLQYHN
ncbi:helix-turn-helix domain-containing protein [Bacteroides acidifaciens]|jgi:transcriptional regulator with XRE-family HTH domain|uniref:helix-turn-helix domain-containing protein n=1 Tax=Bacteroides acidifaciens TaxID=85831 RepID=UPI00259B9624|nr:helix-turn-helix transcriptional regulator [Bacteroides acidifaciens]